MGQKQTKQVGSSEENEMMMVKTQGGFDSSKSTKYEHQNVMEEDVKTPLLMPNYVIDFHGVNPLTAIPATKGDVLRLAARSGQTHQVQELLQENVPVDSTDPRGHTALHLAAYKGHIDVMRVLLEHKAAVDHSDSETALTALHIAAAKGHLLAVLILLEAGANPVAKDRKGCTPMHRAAFDGQHRVVEELLKLPEQPVDSLNNHGWTPLHYAASNGCVAVVGSLLAKGAEVNVAEKAFRRTPLHMAAARNQMSCVKTLVVNSDININSKERRGATALHMASGRGHGGVVSELLLSGAEVACLDLDGRTPLHWAADKGKTDTVALLLDTSPDLLDRLDKDNRSALHVACWRGHLPIVNLLLSRGASLKVQSKVTGNTPLHDAVENGQFKVAERLVSMGAWNTLVNNSGFTLVHLAAKDGRPEALEMLQSCQFDLEAMDKEGKTPLHIAAELGHLQIVQQLGHVVDVQPRDSVGNTPLHLAAVNNHKEVAVELVSRGADPKARNNKRHRPYDLAAAKRCYELAYWLSDTSRLEMNIANPRKPKEHLLLASREGDIEAALRALGADAKLDTTDDDGNTPLHLAARKGHYDMARMLLKRKANRRIANKKGAIPLHLATKSGFLQVAGLLLQYRNVEKEDSSEDLIAVQVNSHDCDGITPLHLAVRGREADTSWTRSEVLQFMLASPRVMVNAKSWRGNTALRLAVQENNFSAIETLILHMADPRDMDNLPKNANLVHLLEAQQNVEGSLKDFIFKALYCQRDDLFHKFLLRSLRVVDVNYDDGQYTMLQLACLLDLNNCVETLLKLGADPNLSSPGCPAPPLLLAASWGHVNSITALLKEKSIQMDVAVHRTSVLHVLCKGTHNFIKEKYSIFSQINLNSKSQDYDKCVNMIIDHIKSHPDTRHCADVNARDDEGHTPIFYATCNLNTATIIKLLHCGGNLWLRDKQGSRPVDKMPLPILERYLDDCVQKQVKANEDASQVVVVNFELLSPNNDTAEWERLEYFRLHPKNVKLLNHPVMACFIYLKWHCASAFFWLNLLLFGMFVISWSVHVVFLAISLENAQKAMELNATSNFHFREEISYAHLVSKRLTQFLLIALVIKELHQFWASLARYVRSFENYMELLMIVCAILSVSSVLDAGAEREITILATLLAWIEFVLLIGRFPKFARYVAMFSTVLKNYIWFLILFLALIIGFVLSFYLIFHLCPESDVNVCSKFFQHPELVILKTMVMMVGEVDFASIPFNVLPQIGLVVFILFVFLVLIVLMNLLNALAVSDTNAISEEAELYCLLSLVEFICNTESFCFRRPSVPVCQRYLSTSKRRWKEYFIFRHMRRLWNTMVLSKILLFPKLQRGTIKVDLSKGKCKRKGFSLPKQAIDSLRALIERKQLETEEEMEKKNVEVAMKSLHGLEQQVQAAREHGLIFRQEIGQEVKQAKGELERKMSQISRDISSALETMLIPFLKEETSGLSSKLDQTLVKMNDVEDKFETQQVEISSKVNESLLLVRDIKDAQDKMCDGLAQVARKFSDLKDELEALKIISDKLVREIEAISSDK